MKAPLCSPTKPYKPHPAARVRYETEYLRSGFLIQRFNEGEHTMTNAITQIGGKRETKTKDS
jgi:hypothetical protein